VHYVALVLQVTKGIVEEFLWISKLTTESAVLVEVISEEDEEAELTLLGEDTTILADESNQLLSPGMIF